MRACWYEKFGEAKEVLIFGERDKPTPQVGEVLVRMTTSGVNPSDVKKRAGSNPNGLDGGWVIPHSDGAGIIEEVGARVSDLQLGQRVWIYNAQYGRQHGTACAYLCLPVQYVVPLPDVVSDTIGACVGIPMMTAHRCVFADGNVKDQTVLITGGSGRVGNYAIQMAKLGGAQVIATVGSEKSRKSCLAVGADYVIKHPNADSREELSDFIGDGKVDRIIEGEFGGNLESVLDLIKTSGVIATYASMNIKTPVIPFYQMMYSDLTVRFIIVYAMPESAKRDAISDITDYLGQNKLKHRVNELSFSDMVRAHELVENEETRGCVVVRIS